MNVKPTGSQYIAVVLQWVLNLGLLALAVILAVFLSKETLHLANVLLNVGEQASSYFLIEGIVVYFLYF